MKTERVVVRALKIFVGVLMLPIVFFVIFLTYGEIKLNWFIPQEIIITEENAQATSSTFYLRTLSYGTESFREHRVSADGIAYSNAGGPFLGYESTEKQLTQKQLANIKDAIRSNHLLGLNPKSCRMGVPGVNCSTIDVVLDNKMNTINCGSGDGFEAKYCNRFLSDIHTIFYGNSFVNLLSVFVK